MKNNKICVIGLGYIGLPTALLFARTGFPVAAIDTDKDKIASLQNKKLYFDEPGLEELFTEASANVQLSFQTDVPTADIYIIAVPTPTAGGKADLTYVFQALDSIKSIVSDGATVILESTVGPRDCEDEIIPLVQSWPNEVFFALCTERAIPGNTLFEMVNNERIIGANDTPTKNTVRDLYKTFIKGDLHTTDVTTAAACKIMENTFRSVNIALANEFTLLAQKLDFDVWEAIDLANKHPRVNIHMPGPGVGGHCIPIDPYFFVDFLHTDSIISKALQVNESMPAFVAKQVDGIIKETGNTNATICLLGCAYKKNVNDARENPTLHIKKALEEFGHAVIVSDPYVMGDDMMPTEEALGSCSAAIIVTDHDMYKKINFSNYQNVTFVYDTRNSLTEEQRLQTVTHSLGQ